MSKAMADKNDSMFKVRNLTASKAEARRVLIQKQLVNKACVTLRQKADVKWDR